MTSLHQQCKQQRRLLLFPPSAAKQLFSPFPFLVVVVLVVVVMFKSLHLAEMCTLTSALYFIVVSLSHSCNHSFIEFVDLFICLFFKVEGTQFARAKILI